MKAIELKNAILNLAIQGKLVPQNETDEPASILLEKIVSERNQLIKDKVIKASKSLPPISDDEKPFDIPDSWQWVRLGDISEIARGGSPRPIKEYITKNDDGVNWIKIGDSEKGSKYINHTKEKIKPSGVSKSRFVNAGDFLLTNSMSFGRPYILNIDGCIHDGWVVISKYQTCYNQDFLYYMLSSHFTYYQFCKRVTGAVVKNLNIDKIAFSIFPLPPLEEQKRIVAKIESILSLVEQYDVLEKEVALLDWGFGQELQKSILQYAIEGKLVPQDESDEPASELLKKIEAERASLVRDKKIKASKPLSPISDDEKPFDIPSSWQWVRLGEVFNIIMGQSPEGKDINENSNGIEFHQGKIFFTDYIIEHSNKYVYEATKIAPANSLLLCVRAPVGKVNITDRELCIGRGLCAIETLCDIEVNFIFYWLSAYEQVFIKQATGTTFVAITAETIKNQLIPLPPLMEQKRIVQKVRDVLALCGRL